MAIQVRVFRRVVEVGNLDASITAVEDEANAFLQTVAAVDIGEVKSETTAVINGRVSFAITVVFLE
jgi:hypothetical protein